MANPEALMMGVFKQEDQVVDTITKLADSPFRLERAHSPIPSHKIMDALKLKKSKVWFTVIGGILGFISGFALAIYTTTPWNLIVSGKPIVAIIPFVVVGFEATILGSVFGNVLGLLTQTRLPWSRLPKFGGELWLLTHPNLRAVNRIFLGPPNERYPDLSDARRVEWVTLVVLAALLALQLENALQAFQILLQIGAGTGLLFILRWFWWRINAWSEISAMVVSFLVAFGFFAQHKMESARIEELVAQGVDRASAVVQVGQLASWQELLIGVAITTVSWVLVTMVTRPTADSRLISFYRLTRPGGPGWRRIVNKSAVLGEPLPVSRIWFVPLGVACMLAGSLAVYASLFATGYWLYGRWGLALALLTVAIVCFVLVFKVWGRVTVLLAEEEAENVG